MPANEIKAPFEFFTDIDGDPLEAGYIYIGQENLDPETNPLQVYWDRAVSVTAAQPLRTIDGLVVNSGSPAKFYVNADGYSITVRNKNGSLIYTSLSARQTIPFSAITGPATLTTRVDSLATLIAASYTDDLVYLVSYSSGWAATLAGPRGGHYRYKTGYTNSAPSAGTAVSVSSIGGGDGAGSTTGQSAQAGLCWDASGAEWAIYYEKDIDADWFGSARNSVTAQDAIYFALARAPAQVSFDGAWSIDTPITIDAGASTAEIKLAIKTTKNTVFTKTTNTTRGALTRLQPARVSGAPGTDTDNYDVNAIFVVVAPNSTNSRQIYFLGEGLYTASGAAIGNAIGIFAPRVAFFKIDGRYKDLSEGVQIRNAFIGEFEKVSATNCGYGIRHNRTPGDFGGTSLHFNQCSLENCDHSWEFDNLVYSTMTACSSDNWASGNYAFKAINRSIISINGGGLEGSDGPGIYLEGAAATSYASATVGGRTLITVDGGNWAMGDTTATSAADFGIATMPEFTRIIRDAELHFNGLWIQSFNGGSTQATLEFDNAATAKYPVVKYQSQVDFGMQNTDFVASGSGNRVAIAECSINGKKRYGENSSTPPASKTFAKLTKTANQAVSSGSPVALTWATPAFYFDPNGLFNSSNGITTNSCGMYKVRGYVRVQAVAATLGLQFFIKSNGSTFAAPVVYGDTAADQIMAFEAIIPVFAAGDDVTIEVARVGTGTCTIVGDSNLNQVTFELL